ncbi:MAG TPA: HIT domain-containing protein [Bacteroidia bacterium]|nr:HIT domain-containing protein [Bacteroidia bacterium]
MEKNIKEETIFEKIINRGIAADIIYEDEKHLAFLDIQPFEKGHILVIPKFPYETVFEMPENDYLDLQRVVYKIVNKIQDELGGGLNILQNNFPIAGQIVPHVHFHLIPRNEKKELYCKNKSEYNEGEKEEFFEKLKF